MAPLSGDDIHISDYITIIITVLLAILVPSGVLLWCCRCLSQPFTTDRCAQRSRRVKEIKQKILDLDPGDKEDILRVLLSTNADGMHATQVGDNSAYLENIKSMKLEIRRLNIEKSNLEDQLVAMSKSGMGIPSKIYVTKSGNHFHLDSMCQHLRQSNIPKLPCQLCVRWTASTCISFWNAKCKKKVICASEIGDT